MVMAANLEHLNEGDTKIEVGKVAANQAQAEKCANWDNGSQIDTARHRNRLPRVEGCREACHELSHEGCKGQVPRCQDDGIIKVRCAENPFVEQNDTRAQGDPSASDG